LQSALTLFVTRIRANDTNNAFTANDLAVAANFLYRSRNSHFFLLKHWSMFNVYLTFNTILGPALWQDIHFNVDI